MYAAWLLPLLDPAALAVDLDNLAVAFTYTLQGEAGNTDVDSAQDVAIDADGNAVVVGYLDGALDNGTNGKILALNTAGDIQWELDPINAGVMDAQQGSSDRVEAVSIDPTTDRYVWCGSVGGSGTGFEGRNQFWLVGSDPNPMGLAMAPIVDPEFDYSFRIGTSDSLDQSCFDVSHSRRTGTGPLVYVAGWSQGSGDTNGQWIGRIYTELGAFEDQVVHDPGTTLENPDQAFAIAARENVGDFAIVGTQRSNNDTPAWSVRYYVFDTDAPRWTHTVRADNGLDARAQAAVYDSQARTVYVAGTLNNGLADASDEEWYVVAYDDEGSVGQAAIEWEYEFGDGNGVDDEATSIALDENANVIVGGTQRDPTTGRARWRVVVLDASNGQVLSEFVGPDNGGDSILQGLDFRDGRMALAGSIDDGMGTGPDFAASLLELDTDGDGATDTNDACPEDPNPLKIDDPGICGCGQPDEDSDGDEVLNCLDGCPGDGNKTEPGLCGCGQPDVDTDQDGVLNCDDFCPADPNKVEVGECGCGTPDDDQDGDGIVRCRDACQDTEPGVAVNDFGCDLEDDVEDPDGGDGGGGCGCQTNQPSSAWMLIGLLLLGWRGRRGARRAAT